MGTAIKVTLRRHGGGGFRARQRERRRRRPAGIRGLRSRSAPSRRCYAGDADDVGLGFVHAAHHLSARAERCWRALGATT